MKILKPEIYILILILFMLPVINYSQSFDQLKLLYQQKNMDQLRQLVLDNNSDSPEILFFKTIFNENGEESIRVYETLFSNAGGELKSLIAKKISEYYYAKGFYVKSAGYDKYIDKTATSVSTVPVEPQKPYHIQVGAFSYLDNANRMKELLHDKAIESDVKVRQVNGKTLYCVGVKGSDTYRETQTIADGLKEKYKLKYQIINP